MSDIPLEKTTDFDALFGLETQAPLPSSDDVAIHQAFAQNAVNPLPRTALIGGGTAIVIGGILFLNMQRPTGDIVVTPQRETQQEESLGRYKSEAALARQQQYFDARQQQRVAATTPETVTEQEPAAEIPTTSSQVTAIPTTQATQTRKPIGVTSTPLVTSRPTTIPSTPMYKPTQSTQVPVSRVTTRYDSNRPQQIPQTRPPVSSRQAFIAPPARLPAPSVTPATASSHEQTTPDLDALQQMGSYRGQTENVTASNLSPTTAATEMQSVAYSRVVEPTGLTLQPGLTASAIVKTPGLNGASFLVELTADIESTTLPAGTLLEIEATGQGASTRYAVVAYYQNNQRYPLASEALVVMDVGNTPLTPTAQTIAEQNRVNVGRTLLSGVRRATGVTNNRVSISNNGFTISEQGNGDVITGFAEGVAGSLLDNRQNQETQTLWHIPVEKTVTIMVAKPLMLEKPPTEEQTVTTSFQEAYAPNRHRTEPTHHVADLSTLTLAPGQGVTISFLGTEQHIVQVWLDNPAFASISFDQPLCEGNTACTAGTPRIAHVRLLENVNIPHLPEANGSRLTIVTIDAQGNTTIHPYQLERGASSGVVHISASQKTDFKREATTDNSPTYPSIPAATTLYEPSLVLGKSDKALTPVSHKRPWVEEISEQLIRGGET